MLQTLSISNDRVAIFASYDLAQPSSQLLERLLEMYLILLIRPFEFEIHEFLDKANDLAHFIVWWRLGREKADVYQLAVGSESGRNLLILPVSTVV